jgi:phospholipase/lecithinase/hemolysin/uncharacterized surface protein with fasciclin (FAS1) repeats
MGITLMLLAVLIACAATFVSVDAQKTSLLFAFGDSYADVGNRPKQGPNVGKGWVHPYGITWPQPDPAGRYSDGKTQTDWFADLLGLPVYPPPYLYSAGQDTSYGVNFAVGGSGVLGLNSDLANLGVQVDNFELFLRTDPYSRAALANSLTLVSVVGNDYLYFSGRTSTELFVYIERVVSGIQASLQRLYDLGLRNVMVANMFQVDCTPAFTRANGYKRCSGESMPFVQAHNAFLLGAVQSLNARNPGARFVILDQFSAFNRLIADPEFTDGLKPCCEGISNVTTCGDVDAKGRWLYTVCKHRGEAVFWDSLHPTMWAWHYVVGLYTNEGHYVLLADAPTLKQWLQINDAVQEPVAAPLAPPDLSSAAGQVQAAFNYLLDKPQYSEALALLHSLDMDGLLSQNSSQVVTVFLPTNDALSAADHAFLDRVFSSNQVNKVALYHVVKGYYDVNRLLVEKPAAMTSMTGEPVPVAYPAQRVFVGGARVVDGNLYVSPGQMVIHGIDRVLMPAGV